MKRIKRIKAKNKKEPWRRMEMRIHDPPGMKWTDGEALWQAPQRMSMEE